MAKILAKTKHFEVHSTNDWEAHWVFLDNGKVGPDEFSLEVDGYWVWYPRGPGALDSWMLRELADCLDQMNKEWYDQVQDYFNKGLDGATQHGQSDESSAEAF